jgi:hypothetical protein
VRLAGTEVGESGRCSPAAIYPRPRIAESPEAHLKSTATSTPGARDPVGEWVRAVSRTGQRLEVGLVGQVLDHHVGLPRGPIDGRAITNRSKHASTPTVRYRQAVRWPAGPRRVASRRLSGEGVIRLMTSPYRMTTPHEGFRGASNRPPREIITVSVKPRAAQSCSSPAVKTPEERRALASARPFRPHGFSAERTVGLLAAGWRMKH